MIWIKSIAMATWMLLVANVIVSGSDGPSIKTSHVAILTTTLSFLDLEHPEQDMAKNVGHGEYRFIGINGYTCTAPGINGSHAELIGKYKMRCLEGTSDMIEGEVHMELIRKASAYAERYNAALEKWLAIRQAH